MQQNVCINMCEMFHYDRLRNDRALGDRKSDNNKPNKNKNKNKKNVGSAWKPVYRNEAHASRTRAVYRGSLRLPPLELKIFGTNI